MNRALCALIISLGAASIAIGQTVPAELWGRWTVVRSLPATTISCWGESEAGKLLGTELQYTLHSFPWNTAITRNPAIKIETLTASQFHDANSGGGANSSQVTLTQLGIRADHVVQITLSHPDAKITEATSEIPGDAVLLKDKNRIVFSVCNVYFEATRRKAAKK
jgi:hypothetical protein